MDAKDIEDGGSQAAQHLVIEGDRPIGRFEEVRLELLEFEDAFEVANGRKPTRPDAPCLPARHLKLAREFRDLSRLLSSKN